MASPEHESLAASLASKTDPTSAARAFTEPTRQSFTGGASESDLESCLNRAWKGIIDVAAETAHDSQGPLLEIVQAVQQQKIVDDEKASECTIWGEKMNIWKDMPLLGPSMRNAWNRAPGSGSKEDFSATQWSNVNALAARLTSLSESIPALDFSLYAIWTLRTALEDTNDSSAANKEAAKVWFTYAKDTIEKLSRENKTFDGKIARGGETYKDKEWRGFNEERLKIWQTSLE